ncbi:glycoside hydrolase family 20 zincin-like fold domain-containing protein [Roseibacillus persicicus]|uniref:glycoside hydrolase family 20 zincin-like fold domain-containing protein n=1 Tax=Roseibacillus persicicus TaxID=454148 RepID=UPI00280EB90A|nr:glycoside hydrolase family 20 zincin-like fold domain-containing protein [Roseibacillus persicicus]MDQ8189799.1 glycoside hydrolase family 20 zincin-like fold domain-containing protein [Roseibacillus persicicus]
MKIFIYLLSTCLLVGLLPAGELPALIPSPKKLKLMEGEVVLNRSSRILYSQENAKVVAEVLAEDFERLFDYSLEARLLGAARARKGDIVLQLSSEPKFAAEEYQLHAKTEVTVSSSDLAGLYAGTATLLQTFQKEGDKVAMSALKIRDQPSRAFRGHMFDMKNQWHSIADCKQFVDMCRFYKINFLSLHSGEDQWIGAVSTQLSRLSPEERVKHRLYSKEEMDELISYASRRGVYLFPHNECTPGFQHMKNAMAKDYVPGDRYAGFPDELDGKGAYTTLSGKAEKRWLELIEIAIGKAIDQFAAGYPDGVLPYFHIGPVLGEGGMAPSLAVQILDIIQRKSPRTKMMFWNGVNAKDSHLYPRRKDCVIAYYDDEFGASDMESYLREGWPLVNAAWSPLYVVGSRLARPVERIYQDWNLGRQGSDGIPGGYGAVRWEKVSEPELEEGILGGMLCTWETPQKVHLERVRIRVPVMNERIWNHGPWPDPESDFPNFERRLQKKNVQLSRYLHQGGEVPAAPIHVAASEGTAKGKVRLEWRSGGGHAPLGYRVFRGRSDDPHEARQVGADLAVTVESFEDTSVALNSDYNYWVVAFNEAGVSEASERVRGAAGTGIANLMSYEPFDYSELEGFFTEGAGEGWLGPWEKPNEPGVVTFEQEGLEYPGLETAGGSLRFRPKEEKKGVHLKRSLKGQVGLDDTTMWMSYLVKPNKLAVGDFFVVPGEIAGAIGKVWGDQFSIYMDKSAVRMKEGETYLVVAKFEFGQGDKVTLWVNPSLDKEPGEEGAALQTMAEIGNKNFVQVQNQGYGLGDYQFDELRIGTSWRRVGGWGSRSDKQAPAPNPMTWIGPPSLMEDGSVFMMSVTAEDESGVEYYFECVKGGGPDSGWQESSSYSLKSLPTGTYSYRVKSRDMSAGDNETDWSFAGEVVVP